MKMKLLNETELPSGFSYPQSFLRTVQLNLTDLEPWYILSGKELELRIQGLKERYPERILIPFARRYDNDDVACFELYKDEEIQIIHDFASVGYEQRGVYITFWDWFRTAIEDMIQFD